MDEMKKSRRKEEKWWETDNLSSKLATKIPGLDVQGHIDHHLSNPPAFIRTKIPSSSHRRFDLTRIIRILKDQLTFLTGDFSPKERYILRKLRYKLSGPFGRHRFWQSGRRICCELDCLFADRPFDPIRMAVEGAELQADDGLLFPSNEFLRFGMCTLLKASMRLARIIKLAVVCARCSTDQLGRGHLVPITLILLGTIAVLFRRSKGTLNRLCLLYDTLRGLPMLNTVDLPASPLELPIVSPFCNVQVGISKRRLEHYSQLIGRLLNVDHLKSTSNRMEIAKNESPILNNTLDMGVRMERELSNPEGQFEEEIDKLRSLKDVKLLYKNTKMKNGFISRTIRKQWNSLMELHKTNNKLRLKSEIVLLRMKLFRGK